MNATHITRRFLISTALLVPLAAHAAPGRKAAKQPNFLLFFPDQFRFDWIHNPAIPVNTPNLDMLAARGVRFTKAYSASPICAPARSCLAAGRSYDECNVPHNFVNYPLAQDTYYHRLRSAGYYVGACGKLDLNKANLDQGVDGRKDMAAWGFDDMVNCGGKGDAVRNWDKTKTPHEPYMAFLQSRGLADAYAADINSRGGGAAGVQDYAKTYNSPLPDDAYEDNWIGQTGLDLLHRFPAGKPWHLMVNFAGPHDPEDITARMKDAVKDRTFPQPINSTQLDPDTHNRIRQNYTAMVENIDRWVGIYIDELKRRGEFENTIFVFSSDHGEMLGDLNRWAKSVPYEASVCVPLIISGPGIKPAQSDVLVSVPDVAATFLDYAQAQPATGMTALSLRRLLEGKTATHRDHVTSGLYNWRLVSDGRYKLIRGFDPKLRSPGGSVPNGATAPLILFDLKDDPHEEKNIAEAEPQVVERLQKWMPQPSPDPSYGIPSKLGGG